MNWQKDSSAIETIATGRVQTAMATGESTPYIGRFAPSPTGPLHFGSLLTAVASYLQARSCDGKWLLRVEDIDPPREQPGATESIIATLDAYGFEWDEQVTFQGEHRAAHDAVVQRLLEDGHAYRCGCSRRDLGSVQTGALGTIYPGTCRAGSDATEFAIRVRTNNQPVSFHDRLQGCQSQRIESESGDFIILRRDGLIAYQLAVVVDDHAQGFTEIVRGIDLMDSTPRQIWLQQLLGFSTPEYAHIPVAAFPDGQKLSKNTGAPGLPDTNISATLVAALAALRQRPGPELQQASVSEIWAWAREHWSIDALAGVTRITVDSSVMAAANVE